MSARMRILHAALGGNLSGNNLTCPTIGHGPKDRGTSITEKFGAPGNLLVHVHNGTDADALAVKDKALEILGEQLEFYGGQENQLNPKGALRREETHRKLEAEDQATTLRKQQEAVRIWNEAQDPRGTPVETYLRSRGLDLIDGVAGSALRWHPAGQWGLGQSPMMVAAMCDVVTGEVKAIHRTALTSDGQKIERRMLGPAAGTTIMLTPAAETLVVGEGIESALSALQLGYGPGVWATGSAGAVGSLPVIDGVQRLVLLEERDAASANAVSSCGHRWTSAGRTVSVVLPTVGKDLNDSLRGDHSMRSASDVSSERPFIANEDLPRDLATNGPHTSNGKPARATIAHQGVLVPIERDRLDIAQALTAAPAFPVEHLPPIMQGAVAALCEHVQAPRSLCAHSVIGAAMLTAQGLADIYIEPLGATRPLSLFMLAVAVSGERKSACDDLALVAVAQHEASLRREYDDEQQAYKAAKGAYDAERRHIERDSKITATERREKLQALQEPPAPLLPIMRAKEPNLEGLLNLLTNGQASVGIFTSEGGQFLGGHGMGEEARTRTVTGLSELWDNGSAQRVRAKETVFLQGRRVGISLAAQPKVAASLLTDELAKDQGFVGRFLVTMPDSTIGQRKIRATQPLEDPRLLAFHRRCRQILAQELPLREGCRNEVQPPALKFSQEAWTVWQGLAQSLEDDCGPDGMWVPVRSAALKMAENVARIAGILTVFEEPDAASARGGTVSGEIMTAAASIGLFYLQEALRLTGHSVLDPETRALSELAAWLVEKIGVGQLATPSLIQRRAPAHLRTDAAVTQRRVRKLVEFGALEYVGRAELDGKTVREAYRITGEEASK